MCAIKLGDCVDVLDNLFRYLDKKSLRTARLVNKTWCDVANNWIRIEIPYEDSEKVLYGHELSPSLRKVRHIRCLGGIPVGLPLHFGENLLSLELKDMTFDTDVDLKEAVFDAFPNLSILALIGVYINSNPYYDSSAELKVLDEDMIEPNTRLRKFKMENCGEYTPNFYDWFFKSFPKLVEIEYNFADEFYPLMMLQSTQSHKLDLKSLKLWLQEELSDDDKFPSALKSFWNNSLTSFAWKGNPRSCGCIGIFDNVDNSKLTSLDAEGINVDRFGHGSFEKLEHVTISHYAQNSYKFLERMPKLRTITFDSRRRKVIRKSLYPTQVLTCVQEITLINDLNRKNIADLLSMFPNVNKLNFRDEHVEGLEAHEDCQMENGIVLTHGLIHFHVLVKYLPNICPALKSLKFFGPCGLAYKEYSLYSFKNYGNVNWKILEILAGDFPNLEFFEHTDDVDECAKEIGRRSKEEHRVGCMLQYWKCEPDEDGGERVERRDMKEFKRFFNVNGFSNPESLYARERGRRIGYGIKAIQILQRFSKLRVLRLQRAVMTRLQYANLKERLMVLDINQLYLYG